ncbi:MAG: hypothetical protein ACI4XI_04080 [Ruminococcus sp.]
MRKFRRNFFRFIILVTIAVLLICCSLVTVFSATKVDFTLNDCSTDNNRLFTISMTADCDKKLSAASFEFTYDKNMFEFRSAKVSDEASKITFNKLDDKVKLVFLNTDGVDINNGTSIFTLTFKSVKSGSGYIDFYVSDCVDSDINSIDAGICTSAKITVNSKSGNDSSSKSSTDKSGNSDSSNTKSEREKAEETTTVSTYDEIGVLNSFDNPNTRLLIVGIAIGASLIAAVMLAYNIFKRVKSNINKRKDSPDE